MRPITCRDFVSIAGAGILVSAVPEELNAQENVPQVPKPEGRKNHATLLRDLMHISTKVADTNEDFAEDYFWINDHTLLFLHLTPGKKGIFRGVLVDTASHQKTLAQPFNDKNGALLLGQMVGGSVDLKHWDYDFAPPRAALSSDRQWLLWPTEAGNPDFHWVAATLDGKQQIWKQVADPKSEMKGVGNNGYWLRDNTRWVEFVKKYANRKFTLTSANIYHLGNPSPVRRLPVEGLEAGLDVGVMQDGRVMLYHLPDKQDMMTQSTFSLVSLEGDTAKVERLMVSIPQTRSVWEVLLSPQGDRLAWVLDEISAGTSTNIIYVSQVDGKDLRPVGTAPGIEISTNHYSSPEKVRWLPDGSRLSFRYNKGIRTVTV